MKTIADKSLEWKTIGPVVGQYRKLIEKEVEADTHKLYPLSAFTRAVADTVEKAPEAGSGRPSSSLRGFLDSRRAYLLNHPAIKADKTEAKKP
jgi:hypothetical protein